MRSSTFDLSGLRLSITRKSIYVRYTVSGLIVPSLSEFLRLRRPLRIPGRTIRIPLLPHPPDLLDRTDQDPREHRSEQA